MTPNLFKLTGPQSKFFLSKAKATAFVGGFGSGKSAGLFVRMLVNKLQYPKNDLGYFAPSYSLVRDIAYPRLEEIFSTTTLEWTLNKADNVITIKDHARILFRTMDNPSKIVGFEIKDAFIDELDTLPYTQAKEAYEKIIARTRQKPKTKMVDSRPSNQIFVGTTPEGFKYTWKMWEDTPPPGYLLIRAPSYSNPHLPADYIQTLRDTYPKELIDAYIEGKFVNLTGKTVYFCYDRILNGSDRTIRDGDELHCGIDFNVRGMSCIIHVKEDGNPIAIMELTDLIDTPDLIKKLLEFRYKGHAIYLYPDASGKSNKTIDASKSDLSLLTDAGFKLRVPFSNPPIKDRVIAMNGLFCNANGERRYRVNYRTCPQYASALEKQAYLPNGMPEKDPNSNIDDLNDAAGYFIHDQYPVIRTQFTTTFVRTH